MCTYQRIILGIMLLLSTWGAGCQKQETDRDTVTVGVLTILTGANSSYGEYTKQGLELATNTLGEPKIRLLYKDTKADPQEAIRVFKELQSANVPVVIGPFTSTEVRQVGPQAQEAKITLISSSATADDLSAIGDHIFMMLPPNSQQGADQAAFAADVLKAKRAVILYRENPYGQTLREAFSDAFKKRNGVVTRELGFPDGEEDFRDRLKELAGLNPDVVFFPVHDDDAGRILRQAHEVNFPKEAVFLGCDGSMSDTMLKLAGDAAEGSIFSNVASVDASFDESYNHTYNANPSPYAASSYDTLMVIHRLAKDGARSSEEFRQGLVSLHGYSGASGLTKFTQVNKSYWALSKSYRQFEVVDGKFQLRK